MSGVLHFKKNDIEYSTFGGPPGEAKIARLVGPDESKTIGAGITYFDGCSVEWTVLYDEMLVVLEGKFRLRVGSEVYDAGPGDLIWIPENTPLRYEGEKARVCYALFPVDWRKRHGMA